MFIWDEKFPHSISHHPPSHAHKNEYRVNEFIVYRKYIKKASNDKGL